jgi:hypothetical protein
MIFDKYERVRLDRQLREAKEKELGRELTLRELEELLAQAEWNQQDD